MKCLVDDDVDAGAMVCQKQNFVSVFEIDQVKIFPSEMNLKIYDNQMKIIFFSLSPLYFWQPKAIKKRFTAKGKTIRGQTKKTYRTGC